MTGLPEGEDQAAVGAAPAVPPIPGGPRPGGTRWGIGLVVLAILVGGLAAAAVLLTTPMRPEALSYVPPGSAAVVEIRSDLPGDQRTRLGSLLAHVPGLADQSSIGDRIDAALERLVVRATDGRRHYVGDLKPFAAGPIYLVVPALPTSTSGAAPGSPTSSGATADSASRGAFERMLVVLTTDGGGGCASLEDGQAVTIEQYRGTDLRIPTGDTRRPTCAAAGKAVLLGDPPSLRAALDARADGRSVTSDAGWIAAEGALPGDHAAWAYIDGLQAAASAAAIASAAPRGSSSPYPALPGGPVDLTAQTPQWMAVALRFAAEGPIIEGVMPDPRGGILAASATAGSTPAPDAVSVIAPGLPASTIAVAELHQAGQLLRGLLAASKQSPAAGSSLRQLDAVLSVMGGAEAALGPLDQAAVVVTSEGGQLGGGLVLHTSNATAARSRLDQIRTLLALTGQPGAASLDYHGDQIVTIPISLLVALGGGTGAGLTPTPGMASLPPGFASLLPGLLLSIAVHGDLIVAGLGDTFVKAVIDTTAGSSLADQSVYRAAVGVAGSPNVAQAYVDVPDVLSAMVALMPADEAATFKRDVQPYLQPIGALAMGASSGDGLVRGRLVLTVP